jgi:hypothetical protein
MLQFRLEWEITVIIKCQINSHQAYKQTDWTPNILREDRRGIPQSFHADVWIIPELGHVSFELV